jgi:hypothetical protein
VPCYYPLKAYDTGQKTIKGRREIVFNKPAKIKEEINLPCGQCIGCRLKKATEWALRITHESQMHDENCFITLTFNDKHLPKDYSLDKSHMQKFFKRLRKHLEKTDTKIKYFYCGEYGDDSWRPHYHAIIHGYDFPDKIDVSESVDQPYYLSETLKKLWPFGNHILANCTFETASYVARYTTKKITGEKAEEHYRREVIDWNEYTGEIYNWFTVDLEPEFACMSRNPAIGKEWFNQYKTDCFPTDYLVHKNSKLPVPRYYDKLMELEDEVFMASQKASRKIKAIMEPEKDDLKRLDEIAYVKTKTLETFARNKI